MCACVCCVQQTSRSDGGSARYIICFEKKKERERGETSVSSVISQKQNKPTYQLKKQQPRIVAKRSNRNKKKEKKSDTRKTQQCKKQDQDHTYLIFLHGLIAPVK